MTFQIALTGDFQGVVNPEVFDQPSFQEKWNALSVQPNPISS